MSGDQRYVVATVLLMFCGMANGACGTYTGPIVTYTCGSPVLQVNVTEGEVFQMTFEDDNVQKVASLDVAKTSDGYSLTCDGLENMVQAEGELPFKLDYTSVRVGAGRDGPWSLVCPTILDGSIRNFRISNEPRKDSVCVTCDAGRSISEPEEGLGGGRQTHASAGSAILAFPIAHSGVMIMLVAVARFQ